MDWHKVQMMGWVKYESGPYTIEKEDTRSFSIWCGVEEIGEASSVAEAKKLARQHKDQS